MLLRILVFILNGTLMAATDDFSLELEQILQGSLVPSITAAAVHNGKIIATGASGVRKVGEDAKVTIEDKFLIGSLTKSMTAVLAAAAVSEGNLGWNTTVAQVFPELNLNEGYAGVTIYDLLTNTGGTPTDVELDLWLELWKGEGSATDQRYMLSKGILETRPAYVPKQGYEYSNAGFSIAGAMMERVYQRSYEDLLSEKLFHPLIMASAGFRAPANEVGQPYGHIIKDGVAHPVDPEPAGENPRAIAPASSVHCSVLDLANYAAFHLGSYANGLFSKEMLDFLHTPVVGRDYAMGWIVSDQPWAGGTTLMHAGSNTMFYAVIWLIPSKNFAAVAMSNAGSEEAYEKLDQAVGLMIRRFLN